MAPDKTASAPSTMPAMELTGIQLEFTRGLVSIPTTSSVLAITGLQVIISPNSSTLVVELDPMVTSPTSFVASTLISMKTPLRLPSVSSVLLTVAPATPSMIVTTKITETSLTSLTRSPEVIEVEKEFMADMIDTFYKG